jgi:predicted ATPase/class 3 adenylate cyclase
MPKNGRALNYRIVTELPSGLVTFLFTDIEGSTELLELLGDMEYPGLEGIHRRILRAAFAEHGGRELGTEGDGFFVAFQSASDALAAALDAQLAMNDHPWPTGRVIRVRMGLNSGTATPAEGNYTALAVNKAARISAAAHGTQIIISDATRLLVDKGLPSDTTLLDLGEHCLRGLTASHRLFQLCHPALPHRFPPLRSESSTGHNLPAQLTSFVGRQAETMEVTGLLADHRLVTLTGAGGVGKSRLAVHAAREVLSRFANGVRLIELAEVRDPNEVAGVAAAAFRLRPNDDQHVLEQLVDYLERRSVLLILDNCEHVIDACAVLAQVLLEGCESLWMLATSRERLGVSGEVAWRVPSLPVASAVALFLQRTPEPVRDTDQSAIAKICTRLDGIPLAIELAASRVGFLSPGQIADRLDDRFRLLTGGPRTASARQRTLLAAVEWSHDLLYPSEQALLRRLSVFEGGCTFEAAEAICAHANVMQDLASLVEKSLVLADTTCGDARYRFLETIRNFGQAKLADACEVAEFSDRHARWFAVWGSAEVDRLRGLATDNKVDLFGAEHDNLLAALRWALDGNGDGDPELALLLSRPLGVIWIGRNYFAEGWHWTQRILEAGGDQRSSLMGVLHTTVAGLLTFYNNDPAVARQHAQLGVELLRRDSEPALRWFEAGAVSILGISHHRTGDPKGAALLLEEAVRLARSSDDPWTLASALTSRGAIAILAVDYGLARESLHEALVLLCHLDAPQGLCRCLRVMATLEKSVGNSTLALAFAEAAVTKGRPSGGPYLLTALGTLAGLRFEAGDRHGARVAGEEALELAQLSGNRELIAVITAALVKPG